ncbi:apolipophorins [Prorops nasuta]|uniref:apolipophorins n=1 Tax=Prorops nasuta TaxID=863751 RepID=UPI0034D01F4F
MGHVRGLSRGLLLGYLLLTFFILYSSANKCTTGCRGLHTDNAYKEGSTYTYDFEGKTVTYVSDAQGEATLKLGATVELSVNPDCIRQVKLKNVQINGAAVPDVEVEKYALQFNYHHGHVDTEVCAEPGDTQTSLNIKRAIISLFQSAILNESGTSTHHETDVFGVCPTDFSFTKEGEILTVRKQKNLAHCSHRENIQPGLLSATYDTSSNIQSSPLLASQQYIEQTFKSGVLEKATSKESYRFRPFSNDEAGAKTNVESTLTFKGVKDGASKSGVSLPKSLIFDAPHPVTKSSVDAINNALKAVSAEEVDGVKPKAAEKFAQLIKVLRVSNKNDILSVYHKVQAGADFDKVRDKNILLSALYRCGSGEAAEVAADLIKNKEITGIQALLYYASLIFVHHVNLPSISAVTSLLDQPDLPRVGYLGIGQVIGKYCEGHPCDDVKEVKEAIHKIREKIGNGKAKTREQENKVISAIKALGNTRFLDDSTIQKLANIAADKNVKNRVRVAAIESLPSRCSMKWKNVLSKVLGDLEEDSEIRIKSYLSLVACACPHVATVVKETLEKEKINQVGSFIISHLRNLKSSTDPTKAIAQRHLSGIYLKTYKFPEDFRKFSFNNEFSYNIEGLGLGSSTESNVIYSQDSFVPRSVSLNLTTELFGRSFNFLELNGRIENLDRVIERYLGPKGVFGSAKPEKIVEEGVGNAIKVNEYIKQKAEELKRGRREVKQGELDKFAKNVHLRNGELDQQLDIDLSVKLFGVELAYLSYQGDHSKLSPKQIIDKVFDSIDQSFKKVKNFDHNLQNHLHFLDAELVYPTGLGLSLSLGVTGTSVVNLKTNGKLDVSGIIKDPENGAARFAVEPSASIKVGGSVIVHGFDVQSGVKVGITLHSSTSTDLSVKMLNGKGIDVNFGIPKKKQEIIDVSSEVLLSSGPKGEKFVAPKFGKGNEHSDCFDQFSSLLGVTVCGEVKYPYEDISSLQKKPLFPLSGPSKFSLSVENNDVTSYHFKAHYDSQNDPPKRLLEIVLETPNSKTNRHVSFLFEAGVQPDKHVKVAFDSPIKKASAEAVLKTTAQEKTFSVILMNDQMEYFARVGVIADGSKYKPILEYKVPEHIEKLAGSKSVKGGQQYNVEGTVDVTDHNGGKKVTFNNVNLISNGKPLVGIDGNVGSAPHQIYMDLKLSYGPETLSLKLDGKKLEDRNYEASLAAVPSKDPNIGFNVNLNYKDSPTGVDSKIVFVHGPDPKSETNRLTIDSKFVTKTTQPLEIVRKIKITYPAQNFVVDLDGKVTGNSIDGEAKFKYNDFKLGTELSGSINKQKQGDYEVEFEVEVFDNKLEFEAKRTILGPHKNSFKNKLELTPGGKYSADAVVTYDVKPGNVNVQVDADLNLNKQKVKVDTALEVNPAKLHSKALVSVDSTPYIDFKLDSQRGKTPNGKLSLTLKDHLKASGDFNYAAGKGDAQLVIDIPKLPRKITAKANIQVVGGKHNGNIELLLDGDKSGKTKKIKYTTSTDFVHNPELKSIDSKNVLDILSHNIEFNVKGSLKGKSIHEGVLTGNADVTLPNGRYITYNVDRKSEINDGKIFASINTELAIHEKKGGPAIKLTHTGVAKDFSKKLGSFDVQTHCSFINVDSKNFDVSFNVKHLGDKNTKREIGAGFKVGGAYVPKPVNIQANTKLEKGTIEVEGSGSLGDDAALQVGATYVPGNHETTPCKLDGFVDLKKIPTENLKNLKYEFHTTLLHTEDGSKIEGSRDDTITYNDGKKIKVNEKLKHSGLAHPDHKSEGSYELTVTSEKGPISLKSNYKHDGTGEEKKLSGAFNLLNNDKETSFNGEVSFTKDLKNIKASAKIATPLEKLRNIDLEVKHKEEKEGTLFTTESAVTIDGKKYTAWREFQLDALKSSYHLIYTCPKGKTELISKVEKLGDHHTYNELSLVTPDHFIKSDLRLNLQNLDEFLINLNFDSNLVKKGKIHAEIANKPQKPGSGKSGRSIVVTVTSDGKNLVTGSTSYKKKDEDGKIVVEGNGSVKIGENTRSSSFKYTRQQLTRDVDGETGVVVLLNANFGPSAVVGEWKLTNKEFHVFNSFCEQNKDCAHLKIQAIQDTDNKSYYKSDKTVELNLKKFSVPVEFGLKSNTEIKDFKLDHTASLYLHSSKDKSEYSYQFYIHPKEAASILTLPTREMALIATYDAPKTKKTGAFRFDISHYLDRKNKPSDKTGVSLTGDLNIEKTSGSINSELKFTYPQQPKDLTVNGRLHYGGEHLLDANLDIDLFAKKSQKISALIKLQRQQIPNGYNLTNHVEINSKGQQLKVDLKNHLAAATDAFGLGSILSYQDNNQKQKTVGGLLAVNLKQASLVVFVPGKELIRADAKIDISKGHQKVDGEIAILNNKPLVLNVESNDLKDSKFTLYKKDTPNDKLTGSSKFVLGQLAEIHADAYKGGAKQHLFSVTVNLDEEKFLKPDFSYEKENIVKVGGHLKDNLIQVLKQLKEVSEKVSDGVADDFKGLLEHLKKAQPNVKPLLDYYQTERDKLKKELESDPTVEEIEAKLKKALGGPIAAVTETLKNISEKLQKLQKQYEELVAKVTEAFKNVYPQVKESCNKIHNAAVEVADSVLKLAGVYVRAVLDIISEHEKDIKELAKIASELTQDIGKILFKGVHQLKHDVEGFVTNLVKEVKSLPIYELLKEKYAEVKNFQIPETVVTSIEDLCKAITPVLPTVELRELFSSAYEYFIKLVKHEKVDDGKEIKKIYTNFIAAFRSVVNLLQSQVTFDNVIKLIDARVPTDLSLLVELTGVKSLKVSIINLILNNELPRPLDIYHTYRPPLNPLDVIPPFSKTGTVTDGGQIFTFDGRHFTLSGTCDYILAQDFQDGNFSVVANFNGNSLMSITLTENKESITIKNNGNLQVNGKPGDYPANTKNLQAFLVKPLANIKSNYGIHVRCNDKAPLICTVTVSGFYLGKLRGLLGDGNNEPYDDFTLPSGKVASSETEFANAYKLKADCPAAVATEHREKARVPICTEYFSSSSPLSSCFNYVNAEHYREACDAIVGDGNAKGACTMAYAYYGACKRERVFVSVPKACSSCEVGGKQIELGDSFSVKVPKKEADVIIVVEQATKNEKIVNEFVLPFINDLRSELKQQGITDVFVGLIGYGDELDWPQHYTSGGSLNIQGDTPIKNMKYEELEPLVTAQEAKEGSIEKKLTYIGQRLDVELGTMSLTDAYVEAINYKFRPGAAKAVIGIAAGPCEKSPYPLSLQHLRILFGQKMYRDLGLTYYHMYFPGDLNVSGKPQKNIVGYDQKSAYTFADSKKKPLEGNSDTKNNLVPQNKDVCGEFAIASGGAAFSSDNFLDAKANQKKQFATVAARKVSDRLVDVEIEQDCTCVQHKGIGARPSCKITSRKVKSETN